MTQKQGNFRDWQYSIFIRWIFWYMYLPTSVAYSLETYLGFTCQTPTSEKKILPKLHNDYLWRTTYSFFSNWNKVLGKVFHVAIMGFLSRHTWLEQKYWHETKPKKNTRIQILCIAAFWVRERACDCLLLFNTSEQLYLWQDTNRPNPIKRRLVSLQ